MDREDLALLISKFVLDEDHEVGRLSRSAVLVKGRVVPVEALGLADRLIEFLISSKVPQLTR